MSQTFGYEDRKDELERKEQDNLDVLAYCLWLNHKDDGMK